MTQDKMIQDNRKSCSNCFFRDTHDRLEPCKYCNRIWTPRRELMDNWKPKDWSRSLILGKKRAKALKNNIQAP